MSAQGKCYVTINIDILTATTYDRLHICCLDTEKTHSVSLERHIFNFW